MRRSNFITAILDKLKHKKSYAEKLRAAIREKFNAVGLDNQNFDKYYKEEMEILIIEILQRAQYHSELNSDIKRPRKER